MEFYRVKENRLQLSKELTHDDIAFILDGKAGYIWKGENVRNLDESAAKKIEFLINKSFTDVKFVLISNLEIIKTDNPKIIQIKSEITSRLSKDKIKRKFSSFFENLKKEFNEFKNYESSWKWRGKLSNLTNIWKLSILNVIIITICVLLMYNQSIFHMNIGDFWLFIAMIGLVLILLINLVFIIFPMKFPIEVLSIEGQSRQISTQALPPQPKVPKTKVIKYEKKPQLTQIEIAPLKAPSKSKKGLTTKQIDVKKGAEYLTEEDMDLEVPAIPDAPRKREKITIDSPGLSMELLENMKKMESKSTQVVLVNCDRCKGVIPIPVPKNAVLKSDLPVVPISYVHVNTKGKDRHCITIYLDHDFDIRRQRISDVVVS